MEKFEVILYTKDEYSSPDLVFFYAPESYIRDLKKGEYSVVVTAESVHKCRQMLDDWFLNDEKHWWR